MLLFFIKMRTKKPPNHIQHMELKPSQLVFVWATNEEQKDEWRAGSIVSRVDGEPNQYRVSFGSDYESSCLDTQEDIWTEQLTSSEVPQGRPKRLRKTTTKKKRPQEPECPVNKKPRVDAEGCITAQPAAHEYIDVDADDSDELPPATVSLSSSSSSLPLQLVPNHLRTAAQDGDLQPLPVISGQSWDRCHARQSVTAALQPQIRPSGIWRLLCLRIYDRQLFGVCASADLERPQQQPRGAADRHGAATRQLPVRFCKSEGCGYFVDWDNAFSVPLSCVLHVVMRGWLCDDREVRMPEEVHQKVCTMLKDEEEGHTRLLRALESIGRDEFSEAKAMLQEAQFRGCALAHVHCIWAGLWSVKGHPGNALQSLEHAVKAGLDWQELVPRRPTHATAPDTQAPTAPDTQAPTAPDTQAPTAPDTQAPNAPDTQAPTAPDTQAPHAPAAGSLAMAPSAPSSSRPDHPIPEDSAPAPDLTADSEPGVTAGVTTCSTRPSSESDPKHASPLCPGPVHPVDDVRLLPGLFEYLSWIRGHPKFRELAQKATSGALLWVPAERVLAPDDAPPTSEAAEPATKTCAVPSAPAASTTALGPPGTACTARAPSGATSPGGVPTLGPSLPVPSSTTGASAPALRVPPANAADPCRTASPLLTPTLASAPTPAPAPAIAPAALGPTTTAAPVPGPGPAQASFKTEAPSSIPHPNAAQAPSAAPVHTTGGGPVNDPHRVKAESHPQPSHGPGSAHAQDPAVAVLMQQFGRFWPAFDNYLKECETELNELCDEISLTEMMDEISWEEGLGPKVAEKSRLIRALRHYIKTHAAAE